MALAAALVTRPRLVLLDEPTSQLDPVAGDELIWLLRRLNEEWGVAILLAEHRLERCLAAADRVIAMDAGAIGFDGAPRDFLAWAQTADPALKTPAARLFSLAGIEPLPVGVRDARQTLAWTSVEDEAPDPPPRSTAPGSGSASRDRLCRSSASAPRASGASPGRRALESATSGSSCPAGTSGATSSAASTSASAAASGSR